MARPAMTARCSLLNHLTGSTITRRADWLNGIVTSREDDPEGSAFAWRRVHLDARVEQLAQTLDDGKSDALPSLLMDRTSVHVRDVR